MIENLKQTPFSKVIEGLLRAATQGELKPVGTTKSTAATTERDMLDLLEKRSKEIFTEERKRKEIEQAKRVTKEAQKKGQHVTTSMREWAKDNGLQYDPNQPENTQLQASKNRLQIALSASKIPPETLGIGSVEDIICPQVAEYYARKLLLPEDLVNNPFVRTQELIRLACSSSADQTSEARKQLQNVMKKEIIELKQLREEYNTKIENEGDKEERCDLTDKELDQLLIEEYGMGAMPTPTKQFEVYDAAIDGPIADANLAHLLLDYNTQIGLLKQRMVSDPELAIRVLTDFERELARGTYKKLSGTKDITVGFDRAEAQKYIQKIEDQIKIEKGQAEADRQMPRAQYPDASKTPGVPPLKEDWITKDLQPPTDPSGDIIPIEDITLASLIKELGIYGSSGDLRQLAIRELQVRMLAEKLTNSDKIWAEQVSKKAQETFQKMMGDRFELTPNLVTELTEGPHAAAARDREFYKRIVKILENPNEEARHQLNLYDQADWDAFISVVKKVEGRNPITGERIGLMLADHYNNLFQTVTTLSDMEYWGNHSAGDVENISKAANFVQNKFAIEAYSDLHVEDMMQCYEMAIKFARDNNGNYINPELARYDPKRYDNFIDQMTLRFFRMRVHAHAVRDYVRDPESGLPTLDPDTDGKTFLRSDKPFHYGDIEEEDMELRMLCSLRLAKGAFVLNNRSPELFAFTRTPGVDNKGYENDIPTFSSKVMGGLTRWDNPLSEWFRMYGFGDTLFVPFFNSIIGAHETSEGRALSWTLDECIEAMDIADSGDIDKLEGKFGKGAVRLMDLIEEMSFSGRHGPLSMWGSIDATLGYSSLDYERLGGSMRISMAPIWAEKVIKEKFQNAYAGENWKATRMSTEWLEAKLGEGKWGEHNEWKQKYENYLRTYKTWIWTDTVMRNTTGVASHVWVDYTAVKDKTPHRGKLRSKIINEIFTPDDLRDFTVNKKRLNELVIERDVASTGSITTEKMNLLYRLSILDGDLGAVQRYAMNSEGRPRDIKISDFTECITGPDIKMMVDGKEVVITVQRRREQAVEYWKRVQREMFGKALGDTQGGWDVENWRNALHHQWRVKDGKEELFFTSPNTIDQVFRDAGAMAARANVENRLNQHFVDKKILVHFGTEDTQWSYLDMNMLGDRHWGRRGGDKLTRAKTITLMMQHFDLLVGKPEMDKLIEAIAKIGQTEKGHDPKEAAKLSYLWGVGTHDMYKQRLLAGAPLIGRVLPSLGVPMSIAQQRAGIDSATFWSINNSLEYAHKLGQTRVIPEKQIVDGRDYGPYTMVRFRKDIGASKALAATEMFVIGYAITALLISLYAAKEGTEEEKKR